MCVDPVPVASRLNHQCVQCINSAPRPGPPSLSEAGWLYEVSQRSVAIEPGLVAWEMSLIY